MVQANSVLGLGITPSVGASPLGIRNGLGLMSVPTLAAIIAAANLQNLNDPALTTFSRTTSAYDPVNNVIKYAGQRRQRTIAINGTNYSSDLIESARTNLLAAGTSEHFERWTAGTGVPTITADSLACPNAEVVADTFIEGTTNGVQSVAQSITKATSALAYAASVYFKLASGSRDLELELDDGTTTNGVSMRVSSLGALSNAPTAFGTGFAVNTAAGTSGYTITDHGGGWFRVTLVATSDATATVRFRVALWNGSTTSYAGNGTSGVYLWGGCVEQATFAGAVVLNRNCLLQSETLGTTWTLTRATISSNTTADPITGNLTADTIVEDNTGTNTHFIGQSFTKAAASQQFTFSVYLKQSGRTWAFVQCSDTGITNGAGIYFDVANGVKGTAVVLGAGWTLNASTITAVGSWYRCTITVTTATSTTIRAEVYTATADLGVIIVTPLNAAALICWGAHLEYGAQVNQYWATTTAGLRTADVLTSSLTGFTDARTNLLTWSEQFDNAAWTKTDVTVTANSGTDPNGNSYCDLLTEGVAGTAVTQSSTATISANTTIAAACWLKASANNSWVRISVLSDAAANGWRAWYNLTTGAVGSQTVLGTGTASSISIENWGNGWYRLKSTGKVDPAATTFVLTVRSADADASTTRVNNAAYYAFGASLEQASTVGTYIPVGGTAITTGPTGLSRTTGTLVSIVMPRNWTTDQDGTTTWRICDSGGTSTDASLRRQSTGGESLRRDDAGGAQGAGLTSTLTASILSQITYSWSASSILPAFNGVQSTAGADTTLGAPFNAVTSLLVGSASAGTSAFFGYVLCLYSHQQVVPASTRYLIYANTTAP